MKWEKIGKIFDPTKHQMANNCKEYAQSPQALVYDNFIRIYFSTREITEKGKALSHISFVDMDKKLSKILDVSNHTVIKLGKLGCFDEHGIFPMNVLRDKEKIVAYTCGWNRKKSVSVDTSIGYATSYDNGLTFSKLGDGPILSSSVNEPFLVGDPFVTALAGTYHMWYIFGIKWEKFEDCSEPERVYKIGYASSTDGITWKREGKQIINDSFDDESQALPTVIRLNDQFHMFFCYRHSTGFRSNRERSYRIGYANSNDLNNWVRDDSKAGITVSQDGWDSDMLCYPHVFRCDNEIYLLYNGNEFGRYGFGAARLIGT